MSGEFESEEHFVLSGMPPCPIASSPFEVPITACNPMLANGSPLTGIRAQEEPSVVSKNVGADPSLVAGVPVITLTAITTLAPSLATPITTESC